MNEELEEEDLDMTQARNELMNITAFWVRERSFNLNRIIYTLRDCLNYYEYQNREDADFEDGDEWMVMSE